MIMLSNKIIEDNTKLIQEFKELKPIYEEKKILDYYEITKQYLYDCIEGDKKLQETVSQKIAKDLIAFTILPKDQYENQGLIQFLLTSKDGRKVRKKEEKLFQKYTQECFKNIRPLGARYDAFEEKNRKLYI